MIFSPHIANHWFAHLTDAEVLYALAFWLVPLGTVAILGYLLGRLR